MTSRCESSKNRANCETLSARCREQQEKGEAFKLEFEDGKTLKPPNLALCEMIAEAATDKGKVPKAGAVEAKKMEAAPAAAKELGIECGKEFALPPSATPESTGTIIIVTPP